MSLFCMLKPVKRQFEFNKFDEIGINLPPIFINFCKHFELGTKFEDLLQYKKDVDSTFNGFGGFFILHKGNEYQWDGCSTLDILYEENLLLFKEHGKAVYHCEEYFSGKLFCIGMLSSSAYLYVSTFGKTKDVIYIHDSADKGLTKVCENIFELCHLFEYKIPNYEYEYCDPAKLYKNWGEDFWRVREM